MFDIGFSELLFVALIALLVLGPERLPSALRTLGLWIGRARHSVDNIKTTIEQEIGLDDIKQQLNDEAILKKMKQLEKQVASNGTDQETITESKSESSSV